MKTQYPYGQQDAEILNNIYKNLRLQTNLL
jgi:hypothetical protein